MQTLLEKEVTGRREGIDDIAVGCLSCDGINVEEKTASDGDKYSFILKIEKNNKTIKY
jgi:hypothetical protein